MGVSSIPYHRQHRPAGRTAFVCVPGSPPPVATSKRPLPTATESLQHGSGRLVCELDRGRLDVPRACHVQLSDRETRHRPEHE